MKSEASPSDSPSLILETLKGKYGVVFLGQTHVSGIITEREDGIIRLSVYFRLSWRCLKRRMDCRSKRADSQSIMLQLVS